jgi:hypothetical protein
MPRTTPKAPAPEVLGNFFSKMLKPSVVVGFVLPFEQADLTQLRRTLSRTLIA